MGRLKMKYLAVITLVCAAQVYEPSCPFIG